MHILHTIFSVSQEAGGTTEALKQICLGLNNAGHSSEIATLDTKLINPDFHNLPIHPLGINHGSYKLSIRFFNWMKTNHCRFDAIICHGLWQFHLLGTRLALNAQSTPYFVYPHGMLDPWFKKQYPSKHFKKSIYWKLFEHTNLSKAKSLLFTCEQEKALARETFNPYKVNESICALGIEAPKLNKIKQREAFCKTYPDLNRKEFILFLSRIHPKKGVDLLIKSYGEIVKKLGHNVPDLVIAGPCSDKSILSKLKGLAKRTTANSKIHFLDMLTGDVKWGCLLSSCCLVLPSHQENFGIVIVEALACQKAVLVSKQVNIWREIEEHQAGFVFQDNEEDFLKTLFQWCTLKPDAQDKMNRAAITLFNKQFSLNESTQKLVNTINQYQ